jgi:uncharacterized metal-binding protein YceD (DUF177 family)
MPSSSSPPSSAPNASRLQGQAQGAPELSRLVIADKISMAGVTEKIVATRQECQALARRFDLLALDRLEATIRLYRVKGAMMKIEGRFEAEATQSCVVTLEPVPIRLAEDFSALFAPESMIPQEEPDEDGYVYADAFFLEDFPEPMDAGRIDLGELVAQNLSLALPAYPRKADIGFFERLEDVDTADAQAMDDDASPERTPPQPEEEAQPHPFAALARLRKAP